MENLKKHKGIISVHRDILEGADKDTLKLLFSNFYPVFIDNARIHWDGSVKLHGYSEKFRKLEEAEVIPEYEVILQTSDEGETSLKESKEKQ